MAHYAKNFLTGRKLLNIYGPKGLGFKTIKKSSHQTLETENGAGIVSSISMEIPQIYSQFSLNISSVEASENYGQPLDLDGPVRAARYIAQKEDELILGGNKTLGIEGVMNAKGKQNYKVGGWAKVGEPINDLIEAVNLLDKKGYSGPYALALSPSLYNALFKIYDDSDTIQMDHVGALVTEGIIKSSFLKNEGVLIDARGMNDIVIGQDLYTGFNGTNGLFYQFTVFESLAPRIKAPEAICTLTQK